MATTPTTLDLLRKAVAAKMAYWDALRSLEVAITGNTEDEIDEGDEIAFIAAELSSPEDVSMITEETLKRFIRKATKR